MAGYNALKLRTLEIFTRYGPMHPEEYMVRARFYPRAAAHGYLFRLRRWGLLRRSLDARGRHVYSLTAKGEARLIWLREQIAPTTKALR